MKRNAASVKARLIFFRFSATQTTPKSFKSTLEHAFFDGVKGTKKLMRTYHRLSAAWISLQVHAALHLLGASE